MIENNPTNALKDRLLLRSRMVQAIRDFFDSQNYLEIDTPIRIPAAAPEVHIDAESSGEWYLQTSPELCMKRLLSLGHSKIFQICKVFRQKERGRRHLPEFTLLEWYTKGENYLEMMDQTERIIRHCAKTLTGAETITYQNKTIDLKANWSKMSVEDAFTKYSPISMETALKDDRFDEVIACEIEPKLPVAHPVFLFDYPAACGALARLKKNDSEFAERFELYMGGLEICNGFSELTDPVEQRHRFEKELDNRGASGKTRYPMPEKFLEALKDMPDATGNALGIDRLVMLFADAATIDEVVAFTPEEL